MRKKTLLLVASGLVIGSLASCGGPTSSSGGGGALADTWVVTFNFNDSSSRPYKKEVEKGKAIDKAPVPVREGYDFSGWYTLASGGESVAFPYTPSADVSLYAHWAAAEYDVTFDLNYEGAPEPTVVSIAHGQSVEPIESPTRDHYVFRYWTLDAEGTKQAEFPYQVKKDVTFYASWRDEDTRIYTVTVHYGDYEGAPETKTIELEDGQSLTRQLLPDPDARNGYDFKGWSLSEDGDLITLPYTPTEDIDVYAVWELKTYKIDYVYNYIDAPSTYYYQGTFHGGEQIEAPDDPSRPGYTFAGWYNAEKGGSKITFPTTGYRNLKYYAHWTSEPVVTDIFHAEYCYFDPNFDFPGYSGAAKGDQAIIKTTANGALVDNYPTNSARPAGNAFAVSYQYTNAAVLRFEIEASEDISGAKFFINWSTEFDMSFGPNDEAIYEITLNGTPIDYPLTHLVADSEAFASPGPFQLTELATVDLKKGTNVITLSPDNDVVVGAITAVGPVTDYIKFEYGGGGKLSWKPIYDNLDGKGI